MKFISHTSAAIRAAFAIGALLCLLALLSGPALAETSTEDTLVVRYPTLTDVSGQLYHHDYYLEILHLALASSGRNYRVETVPLPEFREVRSEISLVKGLYDIHWLHTNRQRETRLRPIRIPLLKGMIGWRLLLVREEDQDRFAAIIDVDPLRKLPTVQGHDWPDALIMQHNGFSVVRSANWEGMFRMLASGRVDYFPRGATEVHGEIAQFPEHGLVVEQNLALHYLSAYYFFVAPDNEELAQVIEKGLNNAIANGSFDEIFRKHFAETIEQSNLSNRKILRMENPLLPPETPLERAELWFDPLQPPPEPASLSEARAEQPVSQ